MQGLSGVPHQTGRGWPALVALAIVVGFAPIVPARADYPERAVKIIVPSSPGGGFDFTGRLVGNELGQRLGGSVFIENVSGAGTLIGTRNAANAVPDGYTLLVGGLSNLVLNVGLYKHTGYDPANDFAHLWPSANKYISRHFGHVENPILAMPVRLTHSSQLV